MLLLSTAAGLAVSRTLPGTENPYNALSDVRISDVLAAVNSAGAEGTGRLTTGAFYQIWADQAAFQQELLAYVMDRIATPGAEQVEARAFEMVADGAPPDEIFRQISDADFRWTGESPELFLALGLGALAPADMVRDAQEEANSRYLLSADHLLTTLLRYAGRQLVADRTMEDLIWATEALAVGYLLRSRTHPEIPERQDDRGWTARASAYLGVLNAFTEPIPAITPSAPGRRAKR